MIGDRVTVHLNGELVANGDYIKVILNGTVIPDGNIREATANGPLDHKEHPGLFNKKGHIAFLGHGSIVRFRNIRVKELQDKKRFLCHQYSLFG